MLKCASPSRGLKPVLLRALMYGALLWAILNCFYVYGVLRGARAHRVETAVLVLVGLLLPQLLGNAANPPREMHDMSRRSRRLLLGLSVMILAATYVPLLTIPLLSDDYVFLDRYNNGALTSERWQFFRPIFELAFWIAATLGRGSEIVFHLLNLALHLGSAWLVYLLTRRYFHSETAAAIAFTVFVLNPTQLEAVLWVSGLQELLWTFFVLAALYAYTKEQALSPPRIAMTATLVG
ncbi:MAG: hypothetical protein H0W18_14980, partial [Acidobacteria bacterium]|nr:hypothetical protein [Acidobacteriota bacterium]